MNTRQVNSAAGVILAALQQNRTAAGIALALESAGLLMSPEAAADLASVSTDAVAVSEQAVAELKREHEISAQLRARVAELEAERHTTNDALADITVAERSADRLTALFAPTQALRVEAEQPGACDACGSLPEQWCPDCGACKAGCHGGHDGNPCRHANAPWSVRVLREDSHDGPLHHSYRVPRDLPEMGGTR